MNFSQQDISNRENNNVYIDDEVSTYNNKNKDNDNNNDSNNDNNNDPPKSPPPPPAAAALLISAENIEKNIKNNYSDYYISTNSLYSIFSWLGTSLYSLASLPSKAFSNTNMEYDHEQVLNTITKLHNHLDFLDKKIEKMSSNTEKFGEKAKQLYKNKNVNSAMHQIRLKKMYDREIQKLESLKFNIETQILHLDSVEIMMVTVDTIKDTSEYYQTVNSNINISKLEDTIDEMVDRRDSSTDIQSILSDINTFNENNYNDDELLKELQEMASEEETSDNKHTTHKSEAHTVPIDNQSNLTMSLSNLPEAPTHTITNVRNGTQTHIRGNELIL